MIIYEFYVADDLYPDTAANIPAISANDWLSGRNAQPIMMSMETKLPKSIHDSVNTKYNIHNEHLIQTNQTSMPNERKLIIDSNYNLNIKSNLNGLNKHKDNDKSKLTNSCDNNSKKFAFLSHQTIPDYRSQPVSYDSLITI